MKDRFPEHLIQHDGPAGTVMIDFCKHADRALVRALVAHDPLKVGLAG